MILDSTYFDEIFVLLHYEVVGQLRIQSIIFYIVLNITTYVELQYTRSHIIRILILPYYYMDCLILMSEQIVMFLKWSMRLSQEVKDLLRSLTWFTYLNLKIEFKHVLQDFLQSSYKYFLILYLCVYILFLCICHPLLEIWWFTCELFNLSRSLEIVGSYLVNHLLCIFSLLISMKRCMWTTKWILNFEDNMLIISLIFFVLFHVFSFLV